jgi:dihydrofolate reductase
VYEDDTGGEAAMRQINVLTFITMDGVMQAPGAPEEDTSGGFALGGWLPPHFDDALGEEMAKETDRPYDLLLGRRTYDIFASHWPKVSPGEDLGINAATKYVVTTRPLSGDWKKSVRLDGNTVAAIRELKDGEGPELQVHGSATLIQTLLKHDLVDELWLKIFPLTIGSGKKLFGEGASAAAFALTASSVTPSGVIVAKYRRAAEMKFGSFALS